MDKLYCINFTHWKQSHVRRFLSTEVTSKIFFISSADKAIKTGFNSSSTLVTWASKNQSEVKKLADQFKVEVWYVEDAFIRSTGLGSDLTAPASLVVDKQGIYYDPSSPSDLESLLQETVFSAFDLERAKALKSLLLKNELSKYNVGLHFDKSKLNVKQDQKIILIPGQVEDDASIKKGCVDVNTNAQLIEVVRSKKPNAYLIYKPHPDVVSGNRKGSVDKDVQALCDLVLQDASITDCLDAVDEVHTMTSLVGFEGLMRGLKVVCYGQPFYSSWGLTKDYHPVSRRTRKLNLDELVAGTLIHYPLYIDWQTGEFTTPEVVVSQLKQQIDAQGGKQSNQVNGVIRKLRQIKNFVQGLIQT